MTGSGYNDPEKLAAAMELARSFKTSGRLKDKKGRPASSAPFQGQVAAPYALAPSSAAIGPPPPSQRRYNGLGRFGEPSAGGSQPPVIGSAGLDFLRRVDQNDVARPDNAASNGTGTQSRVNKSASGAGTQSNASKPANGAGTQSKPANPSASTVSFEERKPDGIPAGTILDTFFSLVNDKKKAEEKPEKEAAKNPEKEAAKNPEHGATKEGLIDLTDGAAAAPAPAKTFEKDWLASGPSTKPSGVVGLPPAAGQPDFAAKKPAGGLQTSIWAS